MCAFRLKEAGEPTSDLNETLNEVVDAARQVILGKDQCVRLAVACVLARGHLLIEDIPGVGKTTLAQVLATVMGLNFQRIQFTSDLLPADILGVSVYDRGRGAFEFHPGPIFAQVILADEVNRATPKAQSALLEAMEEHQVTHEGESRPLPEPFFVIATQNPSYQVGTFPLPESQLDRFLMRLELGYPDRDAERELLSGRDRREILSTLGARLTMRDLVELQREVPRVRISEALLDYVQAIISYTRSSAEYHVGLSPRAGIGVLRGAQAWAIMHDRRYVLPEDIQAVVPGVVGHRLRPASENADVTPRELTERLIEQVPIP